MWKREKRKSHESFVFSQALRHIYVYFRLIASIITGREIDIDRTNIKWQYFCGSRLYFFLLASKFLYHTHTNKHIYTFTQIWPHREWEKKEDPRLLFLTHEHLHIFYKHKNKEKRVKYLERRVFISYGYISFINMFFLTFQTGASIQKKRIRYRFDRGRFKNDIEN